MCPATQAAITAATSFWRPVAGVNVVGDVAAQPATKFGLLLDVAAPPGGTSLDSFAPQIIGAVEQQEVDFSHPAAGRRPSRCGGMSGPSSTVGIPDWATPWATASQASRKAGHRIG